MCRSDETLDASSLKCLNPTDLPADYCNPYCGVDGGTYNVVVRGCLCNNYTFARSICNGQCNATNSVKTQLKQDNKGDRSLIISRNGVIEDEISLPDLIGLNDFDRTERKTELVVYSSDGNFGILPTESVQVQTLFANPTARKRRDVVTSPIATQGIRSPVICVQIGEAILFQLNINNANRSLSNYPRYRKNHLYNTNPNFDYGKFRELHTLITTSNLKISTFANVFAEAGVFVFYDNAQNLSETIVMVPSIGSQCPGRMEAPSEIVLSKYNVGPQPVSQKFCSNKCL